MRSPLWCEPDVSLLAQVYLPTGAFAVYIPNEPADLKASLSYQGAVAVLAICGPVAIADERLAAYERDRAWKRHSDFPRR